MTDWIRPNRPAHTIYNGGRLMPKIKCGRNLVNVDSDDLILDDGNSYLIITKQIGSVFYREPAKISKKLFSELKTCGFLFTSDGLERKASVNHKNIENARYWKFNIAQMSKHYQD